MGWTVLYVGFGFVALWLLGEVLLQYKARLRWRLLAFAGFLGVVVGVLLHSVPVIVVGAIAFAVGQLYVTLSFRRGFSTGWAIKGAPRENKRRRARGGSGAKDPVLEVSDLEYEQQPGQEQPDGQDQLGGAQQGGHDAFPQHGDGHEHDGYEQPAYGGSGYGTDDGSGYGGSAYPPHTADPGAFPEPQAPEPMAAGVYAPEPMPDDTGQYGIYSDTVYGTAAQYGSGYDRNSQSYDGQYGYGGEQQQYPAYSDPYIGAGQYGASYGGQQQYTDPYANDTPPGGVWVPQQRDTEPAYGAPHTPPYEEYTEHPEHSGQQPYPNGHNGYNEQQRY
ncbi:MULTISPECIES: hypothetical protein [unclassified Streptomyces]|uniref:hypothetical protein n=1 Tax=unclassified Streptomyces TaxID=2593676 RepID=UPI002E1DCA19|nr:hypothetical protein OG217_28635 [Streptomyces sp. NBC_01023]